MLRGKLPVFVEGVQERVYAFVVDRLGRDDGVAPFPFFALEVKHHIQLCYHFARVRPVGLVDHKDVGDFHQARLHRLNGIAGLRHQHQKSDVRLRSDVQFDLPDADRFQKDDILPVSVQNEGNVPRRRGEPSLRTARRHGADEDRLSFG